MHTGGGSDWEADVRAKKTGRGARRVRKTFLPGSAYNTHRSSKDEDADPSKNCERTGRSRVLDTRCSTPTLPFYLGSGIEGKYPHLHADLTRGRKISRPTVPAEGAVNVAGPVNHKCTRTCGSSGVCSKETCVRFPGGERLLFAPPT